MTPPIRKAIIAALALVILIVLFYTASPSEYVLRRAWGLNQLYLYRFRDIVARHSAAGNDAPAGEGARIRPHAPAPSADRASGCYSGMVRLSLTASSGAAIHYTTDGSVPTRRSERYTGPIELERTTAVRFASFLSGHSPSETGNRTFLIDEEGELPVVMLYIDPVFLWDRYCGIYRNPEQRGPAWERDAFLEYLSNRDAEPEGFPVLLRIQGNRSRLKPKKAFRIRRLESSAEDGPGLESLLPEAGTPLSTLILRAGGGNTLARTRDELFQALYAGAGGLGSIHAPCALYLNGRYWGIYNMREMIDKEFLRRHLGPGPWSLVQNTTDASRRDRRAWRKVCEFFEDQARAPAADVGEAESMLDGENLIDYWLFNIYGGNTAWPHWNTHVYRRKNGDDRRWRWISWDADGTFHEKSHNTIAWGLRDRMRPDLKSPWGEETERNARATAFARVFLRDNKYRNLFINRFCELLNFDLAPAAVEAELDKILEPCLADIPLDLARWQRSEESYRVEIGMIRDFVRERPDLLRAHVREEFGLGSPVPVSLSARPEAGGTISINGRAIHRLPWSGVYYSGITVALAARAASGFRFAGWTGAEGGMSPRIEIELDRARQLTARFVPNS